MKYSTLALALACTLSTTTVATAQPRYGDQSEASRQLSRFKVGTSSSFFKQDIVRRDSTVAVSGVGRVGGSAAAITPPTRRAASFGVGNAGTTSKPFTAIDPTPTVSPYLALFNDNAFANDDFTYQTIVRPEIRQRAFNEQVVRQAQAINQRLTSISARNAYNIQGNERVMPTGHAATFQNYSRFYPAKSSQQRRR